MYLIKFIGFKNFLILLFFLPDILVKYFYWAWKHNVTFTYEYWLGICAGLEMPDQWKIIINGDRYKPNNIYLIPLLVHEIQHLHNELKYPTCLAYANGHALGNLCNNEYKCYKAELEVSARLNLVPRRVQLVYNSNWSVFKHIVKRGLSIKYYDCWRDEIKKARNQTLTISTLLYSKLIPIWRQAIDRRPNIKKVQ